MQWIREHFLAFFVGMALLILGAAAALWVLLPAQLNLIVGESSRLSSYPTPFFLRFDAETTGVLALCEDETAEGPVVTAQKSGQGSAKVALFGAIPVKTVAVNAWAAPMLVPCGVPVGVTLEAEGVLVLGTGEVAGVADPTRGQLKTGDRIRAVDGVAVTEKEDLSRMVAESGGRPLTLTVTRGGRDRQVELTPVAGEGGGYKLGVWVRDSAQGIGTLTYYNAATGQFGALGHGVYDVDTQSLMPIESGSLCRSLLTGVNRGQKGKPGELLGILDKARQLGQVEANTEQGIYGELTDRAGLPTEAVPVALRQEVAEGPAVLRTSLVDGTLRDYTVEIEQVNRTGLAADKGLVVCITDPALLEATGGIVQGMSGCPLLQNGKLVGAVTHVFVNDCTRGYGIFIENMLEAAAESHAAA